MKLLQLLKLSHAEFVTRRKTILLSVLAAGIPFIIILGVSFLANGIENVIMGYMTRPTDGEVYLVLEANEGTDMTRGLAKNQGEIIGEITMVEAEKYATPVEMLAAMAGMSKEKLALSPGAEFLDEEDKFNILDLFFTDVTTYQPPFQDQMDMLEMKLAQEKQLAFAKFPTVEDAYDYYKEVIAGSRTRNCDEAFTSQLRTYMNFRGSRGTRKTLMIIVLVIAAIIMIGTYVYLLDQELHTMVVYQALGASKKDLIVISLGYLLEIGIATVVYAVLGGMIAALIVSGLNAGYAGEMITKLFNIESARVIFLGWGVEVLWVVLTVMAMAPVSLLLTIDQFSTKRLSQKLKRD